MVYPAHIQWNGSISGHVARADTPTPARTLTALPCPAPDGRSAVPLRPIAAPAARAA